MYVDRRIYFLGWKFKRINGKDIKIVKFNLDGL